jgi:hypothetical protein
MTRIVGFSRVLMLQVRRASSITGCPILTASVCCNFS